MTMFNLTAFAVASALTATLFMGPAYAQNRTDAVRMVSYADLDLTRPDGVAALKQRIRAAAVTVCGEAGRGVGLYDAYVTCVRRAETGALQSVSPALLAARAAAEMLAAAN